MYFTWVRNLRHGKHRDKDFDLYVTRHVFRHGKKHEDKYQLTHSTRVTNGKTFLRHVDFVKYFFFFVWKNDFHNVNAYCRFNHSTNFRDVVATNVWLNVFFI